MPPNFRTIPLLIALLAVATGCGRDPSPEPEPAPDVPAAEPTPTPTPIPPPPPPEVPDDFGAALEAVRDLRQDGEFTEAWRLAREVRSQFAGHPQTGELDHLIATLSRYRRESAAVRIAIDQVAHADAQVAGVARERLRGGDEVTWILLRRAIREGPPPVALGAARVLAGEAGDLMVPDAAIRLGREPDGELADALTDLVGEQVARGQPVVLRAAFRLVDGDDAGRFTGLLPSFLLALAGPFEGDEEAFEEALGRSGALAALRQVIRDAMGREEDIEHGDAVAAALELGDEALAVRVFRAAAEAGEAIDGPFRHLRVTFEKSGPLNLRIRQVEWREEDGRFPQKALTGNENAPAPYRVEADRNAGTAWRVFDRSGDTRWGDWSSGTHWISLDLGPGRAITPTVLRLNCDSQAARLPNRILAEGSMDGLTWVVLHDTADHTDGHIPWDRGRVTLELRGRAVAGED